MRRNIAPSDPLPGSFNVLLLIVTAASCASFLWIASQPVSPLVRIAAAIAFSFVNNTMFSLMHEAVHGLFHARRRINEAAGRLASGFFPTAFSLQRTFHLAHHRNNRTDAERFDYFAGHENHLLKTAQWYCILTGLYWISAPVFCAFYALTAELVPWRRLFGAGSGFARQTSAEPFLDSLRDVPIAQVRLDVVAALLIQVALFTGLGLTFAGWALCYACFAVNWSSLQYADHAFSDLDRHEGAWNLRVSLPVRKLFLNYHYHLVHHRNPSVPWRALPASVATGDQAYPYWRILLLMWAGPRPLPNAPPSRDVGRRHDLTVNVTLFAVFSALFAIVYGSGSMLHAAAGHYFQMALALDASVPFVPWTSIIYLSILPLMCLAPFVLATPERFLPLCIAVAAQLLVAWVVFVLMPVAEPQVVYAPTGVAGFAMWMADSVNLSGNQFPSLHVALAVSAAWACGPVLRPAWRAALWLWAAAIIASSLLTHQHVILDALSGGLLAAISMSTVYPWASRQLSLISDELLAAG